MKQKAIVLYYKRGQQHPNQRKTVVVILFIVHFRDFVSGPLFWDFWTNLAHLLLDDEIKTQWRNINQNFRTE